MTDNYRIIIARTDRIGDVVLSTALPREIKKNQPDAYVAMLVREYTKDIYVNNPYVDEIIIFKDTTPFLKNVVELRKRKFTHAITLLPDKRISRLFFFTGIKTRIVSGFKPYQALTNAKSVFRRRYKPLKSEAEYCLDALRKIGFTVESNISEIYLTDEEKKVRDEFRKKYSAGDKKLIGVHTSSGNSAPNLKPADYRELILSLVKDETKQVLVTDNIPPKEIAGIEGVVYPNMDKTLRESIVNFSALDVLVSASTGPMHLAGALKVDTLSLFCPMTACSPILWGPLGNKVRFMIPEKEYCVSKCPKDPKKCNFAGEGGIDAERVEKELNEFIGG